MVRDYYILSILCLLLCTFFTRLLCFSSLLPTPGLRSRSPHTILPGTDLTLISHPHRFLCPPGCHPYPSQNLQPPYRFIFPLGRRLPPSQNISIPIHPPLLSPPRPPLRVPITPSPTPVFLKYFLQGFPKLCLWSFLSPQRIPPAPYPFIACIPCKYLEYLPQIHPL